MPQYLFPQKVIAFDGGIYENLCVRQPLQIGLREPITTLFSQNDFVILDFGVELCGGVRFLTYKAENVPVRIRFGESMSECCSDLGGEKNATNDHSLRDFTVLLQNYSDMSFGQSGFRFVRLDFGGDVELKSIVAVSQILNKKARYCYTEMTIQFVLFLKRLRERLIFALQVAMFGMESSEIDWSGSEIWLPRFWRLPLSTVV